MDFDPNTDDHVVRRYAARMVEHKLIDDPHCRDLFVFTVASEYMLEDELWRVGVVAGPDTGPSCPVAIETHLTSAPKWIHLPLASSVGRKIQRAVASKGKDVGYPQLVNAFKYGFLFEVKQPPVQTIAAGLH